MTLDVVNAENERVGSVELSDDVFGGRVNTSLIWEAVVHRNASERRGTHATKTRGRVSGTGKKPWRQKGTGRARVGEVRNPLWRGGGTVFGPTPRSYGYGLPRKVTRGALRAALAHKLRDGMVTVVDGGTALTLEEPRTQLAAERVSRLGGGRGTLLVDVEPDAHLARAVGNLAGVSLVRANRLTARDVIGARRLVISQAAIERLSGVCA